jgi:putative DNA primase/helicase
MKKLTSKEIAGFEAFSREVQDLPNRIALACLLARPDYKEAVVRQVKAIGEIVDRLKAMIGRLRDHLTGVDRTVFNRARINKLYGTMVRKGDNTEERPHRKSFIDQQGSDLTLPVVATSLLEALAALAPANTKSATPSRRSAPRSAYGRARNYLAKMPPSISGNDGHGKLYAVACHLVRGFNLPEDTTFELLSEFNERCEPPWSEAELRHKIKQAEANADGEPGYFLSPSSPTGAAVPCDVSAYEFVSIGEPTELASLATVPPETPAEVVAPIGPAPVPASLADPEGVIEEPGDPHQLARHFTRLFLTKLGELRLRLYRGEFCLFDGRRYRKLLNAELRSRLVAFVKSEFDNQNRRALLNLDPKKEPPAVSRITTGLINNVHQALSSLTMLHGRSDPPFWDGEPTIPADPRNLFVMGNGILGLGDSGTAPKLHPHTPRLFAINGVEYEFNPNAKCPVWDEFTRTSFPDRATLWTLQEFFGYVLTLDTRQQTMLLLVGPPRSGKGVVSRVLKRLLGEDSVACPTLSSLADRFGLWALVDKSLAIIADARLSGRTDAVAVVESLLSISGEDPRDIDRKNLPPLSGVRLATRILLMTNELPSFRDASAAIISRILLLVMPNSFLGREDRGLEDRLQHELPGILNWAITGLQRLRERGHFVQPESGQQLLAELSDLASPIKAFVRDCCKVDDAAEVFPQDLFDSWKAWCERHGRDHHGTKEVFARDLRACVPNLKMPNLRKAGGKRERWYVGIRLLFLGEEPAEENETDTAATGTGWNAIQSNSAPTFESSFKELGAH